MASPSGAACCGCSEHSTLPGKLSLARPPSSAPLTYHLPALPNSATGFSTSPKRRASHNTHLTSRQRPFKLPEFHTSQFTQKPNTNFFSKPLHSAPAQTLEKRTPCRTSITVAASKQAAKTSFVSWSRSQSADLRGLEQWLQQAGLPPQNVVIEDVGEGQGRGLVAVKGLRKGDTVLTLPKNLLFTADKVSCTKRAA